MTIKQLSNKIELSFWHLAINLLTGSPTSKRFVKWGYGHFQHFDTPIKVKQTNTWIIICSATGLAVVVLAFIAILLSSTFRGQNIQKVSPLPTPSNGQQNILVIGVDDLGRENPRLVGMWLVIYFPSKPTITFVPIYPEPQRTTLAESLPFARSFKLDTEGTPHVDFLNLLRQEQIWWNGYVLLDETAIAEAVDFFGSEKVNDGEIFNGKKILIASTSSWGDTSQTIDNQTNLIRQLCSQMSYLDADTDIKPILNLIPSHIRTNMNLINIIQDWRSLITQEDNLVCEFPLFRESNP